MRQPFDLFVIGTGSAGTTAALKCRKAGWNVGVIDALPYGGTCVLRGCDPKKVLVGAGQLVDWARRMHEAGVTKERVHIDWPGLMRFKRTFTGPAPQEREQTFKNAGVHCLHGHAEFIDTTSLRVNGDAVQARHILIASGAIPMPLHIDGEELVTTSDKFMELDSLPPSIVFIGGGFISFEFAHLAARAGMQAHIIETKTRPLAGFDPELVDRLAEATRALGIEVHVECKVKALEKRGDDIDVRAEEHGRETGITAKLVVHGGGRVPNIDALNLQAGGIERTDKGIKVNEYLQSVTNPAVYAAGDAADGGGLPLTPVAGVEGDTAAENLLHGNRRTVDFSGLTSVVYTDPTLGATGLSEDQARERGLNVTAKAGDTSEWYSSRRIAAKPSGYKLLIDENAQLLVGAHVLGEHAEELLNVFSLAIRAKVPISTLRDAFFGYPTASSDIEYMI
jgi:glutathione reductase (NADPH)